MKNYILNNLFGFVSVLRATSFRFFVIKTKKKKVSINFSLIFLRHWSYYCINVYNCFKFLLRTCTNWFFHQLYQSNRKETFWEIKQKSNKWMKLIWDLSAIHCYNVSKKNARDKTSFTKYLKIDGTMAKRRIKRKKKIARSFAIKKSTKVERA